MGDEQEEGYQEEEDMVQNKLELARAYLDLAMGKTSVPSCRRSCRKGMQHKGKRLGNYWSRQPQSDISC